MTIVDNQQRHEQQPDWRTAAVSHDLAREHGNRTARIADIAEQQHGEIGRAGETRARYEDGLQVLAWLTGARWGERSLEIDRVLHDEHGGFVPARIGEYVNLLLAGRTSLEARRELAARYGRQAVRDEATRRAVAEAREVSAKLHHLAEAAAARPRESGNGARPALPVASPAVSPPLPQREPMYPPAPPESPVERTESPVERTGTLVAVVQDAASNGTLSGDSIRLMHESGFGPGLRPESGPSFGPLPPPEFSASAVPQARSGDTQRMPRVEADGSAPVEEDEPRLPLAAAASTAAAQRKRSANAPKGKARDAAGSGDGDES